VYRIQVKGETFYLRILPEPVSFAAEVNVHEILLKNGIKVPKIIHFEHKDELVGHSIMIVDEILGHSMLEGSVKLTLEGFESVLFEAGKQLAVINQVPVDGFSWIDRNNWETLAGEKATFGEYYHEHSANDLDLLSQHIFSGDEMRVVREWFETGFKLMDRQQAFLAHGDFDCTHIFQSQEHFTGIIDFGEIRGTSPLFDLGHFKLHDGQSRSPKGFASLIKGYSEMSFLSEQDLLEIEIWALWIGVRRLGRGLSLGRGKNNFLVRRIKEQLTCLSKQL
jgi:aminoglycoside phosphotransferase (APT) family kinase protein